MRPTTTYRTADYTEFALCEFVRIGQYVRLDYRNGHTYRGFVSDISEDGEAIELDGHIGYLFDADGLDRITLD